MSPMKILAFQESTPTQPPPEDWLPRAREDVEDSLTTAAEETGGFIEAILEVVTG
jgi:hypothetical protein